MQKSTGRRLITLLTPVDCIVGITANSRSFDIEIMTLITRVEEIYFLLYEWFFKGLQRSYIGDISQTDSDNGQHVGDERQQGMTQSFSLIHSLGPLYIIIS